MTSFTSIALDARAFDFIRSELSYGNALAQLLHREVDFSLGEVRAIVPVQHRGHLYAFKDAIFPASREGATRGTDSIIVPKQDTDTWVSNWLAHVTTDEIVISESFLVRSTQRGFPKYVASMRSRTICVAPYVYNVAVAGAPREAILDVLSEVHRQPMGFAVVTAVSSSSEWRSRESLSAEMLGELLLGLRHLVIGAYDGESVLLWSAPGHGGRVA